MNTKMQAAIDAEKAAISSLAAKYQATNARLRSDDLDPEERIDLSEQADKEALVVRTRKAKLQKLIAEYEKETLPAARTSLAEFIKAAEHGPAFAALEVQANRIAEAEATIAKARAEAASIIARQSDAVCEGARLAAAHDLPFSAEPLPSVLGAMKVKRLVELGVETLTETRLFGLVDGAGEGRYPDFADWPAQAQIEALAKGTYRAERNARARARAEEAAKERADHEAAIRAHERASRAKRRIGEIRGFIASAQAAGRGADVQGYEAERAELVALFNELAPVAKAAEGMYGPLGKVAA